MDKLKTTASRSKSKRLADLLPQIEDALASGVSHHAVLNHLNSVGFEMSAKTYSVMLARVRSRAKKKSSTPSLAEGKTPWRDAQQRKAIEAPRVTEAVKSKGEPKANVLDWDPQRLIKWE